MCGHGAGVSICVGRVPQRGAGCFFGGGGAAMRVPESPRCPFPCAARRPPPARALPLPFAGRHTRRAALHRARRGHVAGAGLLLLLLLPAFACCHVGPSAVCCPLEAQSFTISRVTDVFIRVETFLWLTVTACPAHSHEAASAQNVSPRLPAFVYHRGFMSHVWSFFEMACIHFFPHGPAAEKYLS